MPMSQHSVRVYHISQPLLLLCNQNSLVHSDAWGMPSVFKAFQVSEVQAREFCSVPITGIRTTGLLAMLHELILFWWEQAGDSRWSEHLAVAPSASSNVVSGYST